MKKIHRSEKWGLVLLKKGVDEKGRTNNKNVPRSVRNQTMADHSVGNMGQCNNQPWSPH
jgi:hypothetical protein